jgi:hypothetical protein
MLSRQNGDLASPTAPSRLCFRKSGCEGPYSGSVCFQIFSFMEYRTPRQLAAPGAYSQPSLASTDSPVSTRAQCQRVWCRVTKRLDCYQRSSLGYAMSVTSLISAFLSFVIASPFIFLRRFPTLVGSTALLLAFLPIGA